MAYTYTRTHKRQNFKHLKNISPKQKKDKKKNHPSTLYCTTLEKIERNLPPPPTTTNLGKLHGNPQPRNPPRSSLGLTPLNPPFCKLALTGLINPTAQLPEILRDSRIIEPQVIAEIRGIRGEFISGVPALGARAAVLCGLRGDVQCQGAEGGVDQGDVVFGEVGALRGEFSADCVDYCVWDLGSGGIVVVGVAFVG